MVRGLEHGQKPALLISECQRGIVEGPGGLAEQVAARGVLDRIAVLAQDFRARGLPVIHSTIVTRADGVGLAATCLLTGVLRKSGQVQQGTEGAAICDEVAPQPEDVVLERMAGISPFHATELERLLGSLGVPTVVITGVSTNIAVPAACVEAVNRGLFAIVPEDAVAGAWPEAHDFQVQHTLPLLATVTTTAELRAVLPDLS
ncbi:MAG: hypothetical protein JWO22_3689 [Frankiales bacterium]|nr:hypothetical protein [Frankiales bacterium]